MEHTTSGSEDPATTAIRKGMVQMMNELPEGLDIVFLTNAAYIQNFDREPGPKSANSDLICQCIESKKRHSSVSVKIVPYHKSPLLIETHDTSTEAMKALRNSPDQ